MGDADWPGEESAKGCIICEHPLPGVLSPMPPPHYPLQHRLLMNAVGRRRIQCFCDTCRGDVEANLHCSTCLRNFCDLCAQGHRQVYHSENRSHDIIPLWQARRFRRTTVCLEHPGYPLRFFCIACQQVTCSECMWRGRHRGHASEGHRESAKSAATLLLNSLKSARVLLDKLLLRYSSKSFTNYSPRFSSLTASRIDQEYFYAKQARARVEEFLRLRKARNLLDAISLTEQLLAEGSDAEILSLSRIILKRFHKLGVNIRPKSVMNEHMQHNFTHMGIFHCCTFCSSGGRKEATCACQGTMPGGYAGCGHGHHGHPGAAHWSCCGTTTRHSVCPQWHPPSYRINL
ncbi:E3 ubiquitin-protein ligase TRIM45 isoform X2 [Diachasmimorpha longicaudata]|uniref:E3 ubiquitin-protein ligase TRIM45 isoform X2 n=1 Tax=Diachasmimorpha longicaudata TaxID=58733 RepID=UPI0030B8D187